PGGVSCNAKQRQAWLQGRRQRLSHGLVGQSIPLVTSGVLTSTFVNSTATLTDLSQNAAGNFAGRIEQTTLNAHLRPNQQFGSIMFLSNSADSVYHSLQTTLRKRFSRGLRFHSAYS